MRKYFIIALLFRFCEGKFQIDITTSNFLNRTKITHEGSDIKEVTDKEIILFNITNENLNRGVRLEMGKVPDEIFLKDPTKYGEVFKRYKWPNVRRKLSVRNITIVEFITQNVVLKRVEHINNSADVVKSKIDVSKPVTNTITALWNKSGLPDDEINFNVSLDFEYESVIHKAKWRDSNVTTFDMIIRKTKDDIEIQSGRGIVSTLLAEKVILLIKVEMYAHLIGNIVANYAHEYGKYHLWSPTIGNIMKAAKLRNGISSVMMLEIIYYTNARLEVVDKDTGEDIFKKEKKVQTKPKRKYYQFGRN